jgi:hypothetical protein
MRFKDNNECFQKRLRVFNTRIVARLENESIIVELKLDCC